MNYLSACLINRIFDVELNKDLQSMATPLKIQKELSYSSPEKKNLEVSKKVELCQQFTVTKNLKEIYDTVKNNNFVIFKKKLIYS